MIKNKKTRERKFLEEVAQIYPAFPLGEIADYESPDFLIKRSGKTIGIEVVDYVRGQSNGESAERRNEVLWKKTADTAKKRFDSKYNIPLMVHIHWNQRYFLRKSEVSRLADELLKLVENHIPTELFENIKIDSNQFGNTPVERFINFIFIVRVRNEKQSLWDFISSGWIEVQIIELQKLIDTKNIKIHDYLRCCEEIWLIIVADGNYISSNIDFSDRTGNHVYESRFEHVLVYDRINKSIFQLKLQRT